jgi:pantoate--beta-alanine ligase
MGGIIIVRDISALRGAMATHRRRGVSVGLVPTMGALHAGHLKLVERARREADRVLVSIFVNPTQFAATEDLSAYPRTFDDDVAALNEAHADIIYAPTPKVMYPQGFSTTVTPSGPAAAGLEDRFRPEHFPGVATVCAKLFLQSGADVAVFGEKDFQQLRVVERMVHDLDIPIRIIGEPTMREADGLALSSRNRYLSAEERAIAPTLHHALEACARALRGGGHVGTIIAEGREALARAGFAVDYLEARDAQTLAQVDSVTGHPTRLLAAARLGRTRLIDNIEL